MQKSFGSYQVLSRIATGGMGEVYLARKQGPGGFVKRVVVKTLLSHLSGEEEFIEMFLDEARLNSRLCHTNIGEIYDLGRVNGSFFLVMEYIDGVDLHTIFDFCKEKDRSIPAEQSVRIVSQVCQGLHYAHTLSDARGVPLGIVHRDICPKNIMVSYEGTAKVIDFGIAKATTRRHKTENGSVKGRIPYMSPEQCTGSEVDARSDMFSLGVVFWELITGRRLFKMSSDIQTHKEIATGNVRRPRSIDGNIPAQLEDIVLKALRKSPDYRYQSALEMKQELDDYLDGLGTNSNAVHLAPFMKELFKTPYAKHEEPVEVPDTDVQVPVAFWDAPLTRSAEAEKESRKCPKCMMESMLLERHDDLEIDRCPACRGIFLDRGEMRMLLRRKLGDKIDHHIFAPTPEILDAARAFCAGCGWEMDLVQGPFAVFFNSCKSCGGIFLDAGELSSLQRLPDALLE
jgi:serine/threonine protein kinase/Zn-finger nucleic acid-binding protein